MEDIEMVHKIIGRYCIHARLPSVEVVCPLCGRKHYHGWADTKMAYPAYRDSHCGRGSYYIEKVA